MKIKWMEEESITGQKNKATFDGLFKEGQFTNIEETPRKAQKSFQNNFLVYCFEAAIAAICM